MASLVQGKWSNTPIATNLETGEFDRAASSFRDFISQSEAEAGRYHLYVSYACPWAHRTIITRSLKKLEEVIPMSVTNPYMGEKGWTFGTEKHLEYLADVYRSADKLYTGKITVPVLWDNRLETIVNNESSEIIRIINSSFDYLSSTHINITPEEKLNEIEAINETVYENINNGVYRAGFASKQDKYEKACKALFSTLTDIEKILTHQKFLVGDKFTEADLRLFTTLIRFDSVYYIHFKCSVKRIKDYHNLFNYMKCIYQIPEVKKTCFFDHIKEHYYKSHKWINPFKIVPLGPILDLEKEHDRGLVQFHYFNNSKAS